MIFDIGERVADLPPPCLHCLFNGYIVTIYELCNTAYTNYYIYQSQKRQLIVAEGLFGARTYATIGMSDDIDFCNRHTIVNFVVTL